MDGGPGGSLAVSGRRIRRYAAPYLRNRARQFRGCPSGPERALWALVRRRQLGVRFRRQVVVLGYIADFYCPAAGLVVEVDGPHHEYQGRRDAARDAAMEAIGLKVLRLRSSLVLETPALACHLVRRAMDRPRG